MKTAIYIKDGVTQVVLTKESDFDAQVLKILKKGEYATFYDGSFYHCQGGWFREGGPSEDSVIIKIEKEAK